MGRRIVIIGAIITALIAGYFVWRKMPRMGSEQTTSVPANQSRTEQDYPAGPVNKPAIALRDTQDAVFLKRVFPKFREFVAKLDALNVNPFKGDLQPASCSKVQITPIPNGIMCRFVIGEGWTAGYIGNPVFSGIDYFGQSGPDNPNRAISHADTNALRRLSQGSINMPEAEVWKIANRVEDAFGIDRSKFEKPEMFEEALFDYHLGIYTIQYRKKGSDPINQLNYTRDFSLKATSPTTAVLVRYTHLAAIER